MPPAEPLLCVSDGAVTMLTYQKFKCRLYRIIGPFLGRRRESSNARSLSEVHQNLLQWHESVPIALRCEVEDFVFENRPETIQLQALALQLAYDNLQIVLHRQAVFATKASEMTDVEKQRSVDQLLTSAHRTAGSTRFKVAETISRSSHAAMHFGICLFTAGVVLCALTSTGAAGSGVKGYLENVDRIILFLRDFPGQQYRLAGQSYEILSSLRSRCGDQSEPHPEGGDDLLKIMVESATSEKQSTGFCATNQIDTDSGVEYAFDASLQDAFQSWLWVGY